jgi:succinate-semialdehyde dehydrogenase / glutarate-semialdehyde dehydrogenase
MEVTDLGTGSANRWQARIAGAMHAEKGYFPIPSPVTGQPVAMVASCGREHALLAAEGAALAATVWRRALPEFRGMLLRRWAELIAQCSDRISASVTLETGKPVGESRAEVVEAISYIERCAEFARVAETSFCSGQSDGRRIISSVRGVGTVLAITNWCQPTFTVVRRAALALASGCQIIIKPSSRAPLAALMLADLWTEAGGPMGTLQVLTTDDPVGTLAACLQSTNIDLVSFTGSQDVGQYLTTRCAEAHKYTVMELDGLRPMVVFPDADLKKAADAIVECVFLRNAGQDCTSANRLYVHEAVAERLIGMLRARVLTLKVGDPREPDTQVGPLIDGTALTMLLEHIDDATEAGGRLVVGGRPHGGLRIAPTILDFKSLATSGAPDAPPGPLVSAFRFSDADHVAAIISETVHGGAAWIWSADIGHAVAYADELGFAHALINEVGTASRELSPLSKDAMVPGPHATRHSPYLRAVHRSFPASQSNEQLGF